MRWLLIFQIRILTILSGPLAAFISLQTLQNTLNTFGYPAVTLFIMIESAGIPFPGETMLLLASFYAGTNHQLQIPIVIACAAAGARVRRLASAADYAERFFAKHGDKTVFFGRFVAVLRAWAAFLAGVNHMQWRTFLIYNAAGGIVWAIIYGTLGFVAGRIFHDNFAKVEQIASTIGWIGAALFVGITIGLFIFFRLRRNRHIRASLEAKDTSEEQSHEEHQSGETVKK